MPNSKMTRRSVAIAAAMVLVLAGCGGGDDDAAEAEEAAQEAVDDAEELAQEAIDDAQEALDDASVAADDALDDARDAADDAAEAADEAIRDATGDDGDDAGDALEDALDEAFDDDGDDGGGSIGIGDVPQSCRDLAGDFLEGLEPIVGDIDWANMTIADFEALGDDFDDQFDEFEDEFDDVPEECEDLDLGDEETYDMLHEIAEDRAPGTIGFLDWQRDLLEGFDAMTDVTLPNVSLPDDPGAGESAQSCEEAIAVVEAIMAKYDTMMSMPLEELTQFSSVQMAITSQCSVGEMSEFFERDDVLEFLGG